MGVDYNAAGGVGIRISDEILEKLGYNEEEDDSICDFLDNLSLKIPYTSFGDSYQEEYKYAWIIKGGKYLDVVKNIPEFLSKLNSKGFNFTEEDLEVIVEIHIW